jgi:hypothetical protein
MPTGYTAELMEKGQSFNEFVMRCARGMGACIMMRDDPMDAPIPVFEPSDYNAKRLVECRDEHYRLLAMNGEEKIAFGESKRKEHIQRMEQCLAKNLAENQRLIDMQKKVAAWQPPTPDHQGLKDFMLQQIEVSMNGVAYYEEHLEKAKASSALDYYLAEVAEAERGRIYNAEQNQKEIERTESRNRWVRELKASL